MERLEKKHMSQDSSIRDTSPAPANRNETLYSQNEELFHT
jgi:hypothetical protein